MKFYLNLPVVNELIFLDVEAWTKWVTFSRQIQMHFPWMKIMVKVFWLKIPSFMLWSFLDTWQDVIIGSGNGLVPSENKPLLEPMLL